MHSQILKLVDSESNEFYMEWDNQAARPICPPLVFPRFLSYYTKTRSFSRLQVELGQASRSTNELKVGLTSEELLKLYKKEET